MVRRHRLIIGMILSLLMHGAGVFYLSTPPPRPPQAARESAPTRIRLASLPEPPAPEPEPPAPEPEPPAPEPEPPKVEPEPPKPEPPKPRPPRRRRPPPPTPEPEPAPEPEPGPEPEPPPVMKFSYEMNGGAQGSVAVPGGGGGSRVGAVDGVEGGTLDRRFGEGGGGDEAKSEGRDEIVALAEVTSRPRLISQPSSAELRRAYPDAARRKGLEADVVLRVLVGPEGEVRRATVLRGAGEGFDEAAEKLARRLRFRPGRQGGRPVAVWVTFPFRFRLDD